uniref:Chemokine interleukin-8-like domain-containing protein n=1 Tax=Amphilophus citrinellus TaxID=61819 RepID=A0A3Q0R221_AMPCI
MSHSPSSDFSHKLPTFSLPARRNPSRSRLCCIGVTSINKSSEVVGETYRVQSEKSPCVKAIIFNTDDGKLCADPKAQWVKKLIANMTKV